MTLSPPKPVTILSGFLGSGKTTLLNQILNQNHGIRYAVIVNEFGEIGLDDQLLEGSQDFVKMDNGCLCCVLSDELVETIAKLNERDDYDAVVLETTGVADPLPIAWPFLRPEFKDAYRFAGIVTVVDVANLEKMLSQSEEARLQIERADFLYLSKTDLVDKQQKSQIVAKLKSINSNARLVDPQEESALEVMIDHDHELTLPQVQNDHHTHYESVSKSLKDQTVTLEQMEDYFELLPDTVFRAKAIFQTPEKEYYVMHAVCGRIDFYKIEKQPQTLGVVLIGQKVSELKINV